MRSGTLWVPNIEALFHHNTGRRNRGDSCLSTIQTSSVGARSALTSFTKEKANLIMGAAVV